MSPSCYSVVLLFALAGTLSVEATGHKWDYNNPDHWDGTCLSGRLQSPIDLDEEGSISGKYENIAFINYDEVLNMRIVNNGHTVQFNIENPKASILVSGGLPGVYYFAQMHFHWGSEHTIKGERYPLEAHLVHYERMYSDISEAMTEPDGIAVVGLLFTESAEDNPDLDPLIATLEQVNGVVDKEFPVQLNPGVVLPQELDQFYRYRGSLTTPACHESVVWTVMATHVSISKSQYERFQNIRVVNGTMGDNYRPVQEKNNRPVTLTTLRDLSGGLALSPKSAVLATAITALYSRYFI